MDWSNACVSAPITIILPTTVGTFHHLNCFSHKIYILQTKHKVKLVTIVKGDLKAPFLIATTLMCRRGCYFFPRIDPIKPKSLGPLANTLTIMPMTGQNLATLVEGDPKALFSIATTLTCRGGCYSIPWIAPLILTW